MPDPAEQRIERALAALAAVFASPAMAEPYGEEISIRDHMLQCAELAVARRAGDAMIAAALLHDIGWAMGDGPHEQTCADYLEPLFGPAVAEPVRQHVAAKRYLVGTRPDYHATLSAASRRTLARQGGPMSAADCLAFAAAPACAAALELRSLDDAGKTLDGASSCLADYIPLLRRQMLVASRPG